MKSRKTNKIMSAIAALLLVLAMVPTAVFAAASNMEVNVNGDTICVSFENPEDCTLLVTHRGLKSDVISRNGVGYSSQGVEATKVVWTNSVFDQTEKTAEIKLIGTGKHDVTVKVGDVTKTVTVDLGGEEVAPVQPTVEPEVKPEPAQPAVEPEVKPEPAQPEVKPEQPKVIVPPTTDVKPEVNVEPKINVTPKVTVNPEVETKTVEVNPSIIVRPVVENVNPVVTTKPAVTYVFTERENNNKQADTTKSIFSVSRDDELVKAEEPKQDKKIEVKKITEQPKVTTKEVVKERVIERPVTQVVKKIYEAAPVVKKVIPVKYTHAAEEKEVVEGNVVTTGVETTRTKVDGHDGITIEINNYPTTSQGEELINSKTLAMGAPWAVALVSLLLLAGSRRKDDKKDEKNK